MQTNSSSTGGNTYYPPVDTVIPTPITVTGVSINNPAGTGDVTVTASASNYGSNTAKVELLGVGAPAAATSVTIGENGLISKTFNNVSDGTYTAKVTIGTVNASSSQFTVAIVPIETTQTLTSLVISTSQPTIGTTITVTPKDASNNTISSSISYQWYYTDNSTINDFATIGTDPTNNWVAITGATTNPYTPSADDLTHRLMIKAMGADGSYICYGVYDPAD